MKLVNAVSRPPLLETPASIGFNLGAIMAVITLLGLGAAYLLVGVLHPRAANGEDPAERVVVSLTGRDLTVPAVWLEPGQDLSQQSLAKELHLRLRLANAKPGADVVEVTILQRSRVRTSASLLDSVYLHQFQDVEVPGPPGLVGKPLRAEAGYGGETVWYDPIGSDPFVAKCAPLGAGRTEIQCLRTVNLGTGLAAVYAFSSQVLPRWRSLDGELAPMLRAIGAL